LPVKNSQPPENFNFAILVWNMCGGSIDWQALPIACEIYGITDIEQMIFNLMLIKESQNNV
jgi:hypothetical protein